MIYTERIMHGTQARNIQVGVERKRWWGQPAQAPHANGDVASAALSPTTASDSSSCAEADARGEEATSAARIEGSGGSRPLGMAGATVKALSTPLGEGGPWLGKGGVSGPELGRWCTGTDADA